MPKFLEVTNTAAARTALGGTQTGSDVFTADDPAAARTAINAYRGLDVTDFGAVGDAVAIHLAGTTIGSAVVTSPDNLFTEDMVGKTIVISGANADDSAFVSTVASYQSPGQITMADTVGKVSSLIRVNAVVGTDNSAAFAAAFDGSAAEVDGLSISVKQWRNIERIYVPPGNYLTLTGVPALQDRGHALVGAGYGSTQIWHCGEGPFLEMGTFNANGNGPSGTGSPWYNPAWGLRVSNLSLHAPIFARDQSPSRRVGIGIQDNGSGHLFVEHCWISGFDYGIYATSGSDYTQISDNVSILDCNVGIYFGPSSQQIVMSGVNIGRCGEGIVAECAQQAVLTGCVFGADSIADVVFEAAASGLTRAGMPFTIPGGSFGPWQFLNCWFESGPPGPSDTPQHILIDSQRPVAPGILNGWEGIAFRDCFLISGGTQNPAGTVAFIHDSSLYPANPIISNLVVAGKYINCIYRYSGPAGSFSPVIEAGYVGFDSDIAKFMGPGGVAAVQTNLPGVITSPNRLTLSKVNIDDATITNSTASLTSIELGHASDTTLTRSAAGSVAVEGVDLVRVSGAQTITQKTLTLPRVDAILDPNGYRSAEFEAVLPTSTNENLVNRWRFRNGTTGGTPGLFVVGSDTDISANIFCKNAGAIRLRSDAHGIGFMTVPVANGVNYLNAQSNTTGQPAQLFAQGETNVGIDIRPAGNAGVRMFSTLTDTTGIRNAVAITHTVNQSSTAGYTMLLINPTETGTGSGTKRLIDAQTGGTSRFTIDNTGNAFVGGTLDLGNASDTTISRVSAGVIAVEGNTVSTRLTNTATLDFGSVTAQSFADLTITVTGAATGDAVALGTPTAAITAGIAFTAWVSATNTVTVRAHNYTAGALDPASGVFRATVIR